jgi:hypothetical protein
VQKFLTGKKDCSDFFTGQGRPFLEIFLMKILLTILMLIFTTSTLASELEWKADVRGLTAFFYAEKGLVSLKFRPKDWCYVKTSITQEGHPKDNLDLVFQTDEERFVLKTKEVYFRDDLEIGPIFTVTYHDLPTGFLGALVSGEIYFYPDVTGATLAISKVVTACLRAMF